MHLVNRIILAIVILPLLIVVLMPKKELYYLLEKRLEKQHIVISGEKLESGLFSLDIKHPKIYYMGSQVASADTIRIWTLLAYSEADIKMLSVAKGLPAEILLQKIKASHSLISPQKIKITGIGSIGKIYGNVLLNERKIELTATKANTNINIARYMKKSKEGWKYESRY